MRSSSVSIGSTVRIIPVGETVVVIIVVGIIVVGIIVVDEGRIEVVEEGRRIVVIFMSCDR